MQHVSIEGLVITKEDYLGYEITDVFNAKNLVDVSNVLHVLLSKSDSLSFVCV